MHLSRDLHEGSGPPGLLQPVCIITAGGAGLAWPGPRALSLICAQEGAWLKNTGARRNVPAEPARMEGSPSVSAISREGTTLTALGETLATGKIGLAST